MRQSQTRTAAYASAAGPPTPVGAYESTAAGSRQVSSSSDGGERSEQGGLPKEGEAFAHYRLIRQLGIGAFGVVWYARDERDGREVALKVLANVTAGSLERFQLEIKATAKLEHPSIVPLLDYGEARDHPYLAMGYVDGGSLKEIKELSFEEVAAAMRDVAYAVDYAHQNEVLHRDIKPDNIMIDADGNAWVLDFGLAQLGESDGLTKTGDMVGTPAYMAPEQAKGEGKRVDGRCDVYSLGATMFFSLTGMAPFYKSQTIHAQLAAVLFEEPPAPSSLNGDVPKALDWIILKCLEKKPARRYASAAALGEDLGLWLEGKPVRARPSKRKATQALRTSKEAPASGGGGRTVQLAAVVVVLIVLATAIFVAVRTTAAKSSPTPEPSAAVSETPPAQMTPRASPSPTLDANRGRAELASARDLAKRKKPEAAISAASGALAKNPSLDEARELRAELLAGLRRWEPAVDDLSVLIDRRRFDVGLRAKRGRAYLELRRLDLAAEDARIARSGKRQTIEIWILSAEVSLAQGEPRVAIEHLGRVGPADRKSARFRRLRGRAYLANGDLDSAEGDLDDLVRERDTDGVAWLALGRVHLARKRREVALETFEEGLAAGAKHAPLAVALGALYEADGRSKEALNHYRYALSWDAGNSLAQKGITRLSGGGPTPSATPSATPTPAPVAETTLIRDEAEWPLLLDEPWPSLPIYPTTFAANWGNRLSGCRRALKGPGNSQKAPLWVNLGKALAARKKYDEAVLAFRRALAINQEDSQALRELGAALLELAKPREALESLESSVGRNKHDPESLRLLGIAALRAKKAGSHAGKLRSAIPRFKSVVGLYCVLARCEVAAGRLGKAEKIISEGLEQRRRSRELLLERALVRARGGDYDLALEDLSAYAKLDFGRKFEPWVTRFRIRTAAQAGQLDPAIELAQATFEREEGKETRTLALWGLLRGLKGDHKAGAVDLGRAFRSKPRPEYLLLKGIFRIKSGEKVSAELDFETFCKKWPKHPKAPEIKRYLKK